VAVTGGAGFIGSHLVDALCTLGAEVVALDDLSNGRRANLAGAGAAARFVEGSIASEAALDDVLAGADVAFHLAAKGSVPQSIEMPARYHEVNVGGTLAVLEACRRHGVRRVVYSASSSAYGDQPGQPKVEHMVPDPCSPYAYSKLACEYLMRTWARCYGVETVSLRYFNIFGPRQRHDSPYAAVVPIFAERIRAGEAPVVYGDGTQSRDFTHVANAVHANLLAGSRPGRLAGETVNIACGTSHSLLELLERMSALLGRPAAPEFRPARLGDVMHSCASIDAARTLLGYEVIVPFDEGLRTTLMAQK
jgi:nucleoside-diphosphate-sugar epimerase